MMKVFMLFLLPFFVIFSNTFEEEKIAWDKNRPLTWEDFKGIPNRADDFVASTNSGVSFSFSFSERNGEASVTYTVLSNFYPNLSWYRKDRVTTYILEHEQTHFDISELHARKLRKALSSVPHNKDFKEKAEQIYNALEMERREMQTQYDKESDHSNIKEYEYRWRDYVAEQLKAFEAWK
ncbi:MAG: DUF922 domain-containing protein [Flavobacteriaceae bacterium]